MKKLSNLRTVFVLCSLIFLAHQALALRGIKTVPVEDLANTRLASVVFDSTTGKYSLKDGVDKSAVAYGKFVDSLNTTGWDVLEIKTNSGYTDEQQFYAAGYLEGAVTNQEIWENYHNMFPVFFPNGKQPSDQLLEFIKRQDLWTRTKIAGDWNHLSDYWKQVRLIVNQFDGLYRGYVENTDASKQLDIFAFQMLNGVGDFLDLLPALEKDRRPNWDTMTDAEIESTLARNGHCSALIKLTGDYSDMFAGHSSWFVYAAMNRIYKHYDFEGVTSPFIKAKLMSFSSYPGFLESLDDFYILSSGLVMLQTTNSIINAELYKKVVPHTLFAWQRVRLANHMADNGRDWTRLVGEHNSGTYNNQYMVIDYKLFTPLQPLVPNTLWVAEQIPGLVESADVTRELERGYWPSYNVPYFIKIFNTSGYPSLNRTASTYQLAPRAEIFRRDQGKVVDIESFKAILRYNDYENDPYSDKDPGRAICSRFDLASSGAMAGGCYDTKVTSYTRQQKRIAEAINGPTTSHNIPPFSWTKWESTAHYGMPTVFDFSFEEMKPSL